MAEKKMTFEEKMAKLEKIANEMETNNLSLEDSLKAYEEAQLLIKDLEKTIKEAKEKVEKSNKSE